MGERKRRGRRAERVESCPLLQGRKDITGSGGGGGAYQEETVGRYVGTGRKVRCRRRLRPSLGGKGQRQGVVQAWGFFAANEAANRGVCSGRSIRAGGSQLKNGDEPCPRIAPLLREGMPVQNVRELGGRGGEEPVVKKGNIRLHWKSNSPSGRDR